MYTITSQQNAGSLFAFMEEITVLQPLSKRDRKTLDEYFKSGMNATQAWMVTHPSAEYDSARASASKWLTKSNVKAEIEARLVASQMSADEAIARISDIAKGDIAQIMDVSSVGFNLDMAKAKELGLTKLIKKVKQKTTIYQAKGESEEDREVTELEVELYSAHEALRDIAKIHGRYSQREDAPKLPVDALILKAPALLELVDMLERQRSASMDKARAIEGTVTRNDPVSGT